jgi:hypothetical protein
MQPMSRRKDDQPPPEQPYYTLDTSLFTGRFRYFSRTGEPVLVRGKVHKSEEQYSLRHKETEIVPIKTLKGQRSYFHLKPYVLVPDIRLTIGLYNKPKQYADQEPAIGEVIDSYEQPKMKEQEIGQAQAWYYPLDKTIVLWECYLYEFVRETSLSADPNMRDLWQGFERFLRTQCVGAERITTPSNDPIAETIEKYQRFLGALSYQPVAKAAWGKPIELG